MSQATIQDVTTVPRIAHGEAMQIAAAENARFARCYAASSPATGPSPPTARCGMRGPWPPTSSGPPPAKHRRASSPARSARDAR